MKATLTFTQKEVETLVAAEALRRLKSLVVIDQKGTLRSDSKTKVTSTIYKGSESQDQREWQAPGFQVHVEIEDGDA